MISIFTLGITFKVKTSQAWFYTSQFTNNQLSLTMSSCWNKILLYNIKQTRPTLRRSPTDISDSSRSIRGSRSIIIFKFQIAQFYSTVQQLLGLPYLNVLERSYRGTPRQLLGNNSDVYQPEWGIACDTHNQPSGKASGDYKLRLT